MRPQSEWIKVSEAARMLGYSTDGFRRKFCDGMAGITVLSVPTAKGRSLRVLRADVLKLVSDNLIR